MLSHLQHSLASALNSKINKKIGLPQYIVVVLDDNLITFLDFKGSGISMLLGSWIEWLADSFSALIEERKKMLPPKCNRSTFFYWVSAPIHSFFSRERNDIRIRFNLSLDSVIRGRANMRIMKIKENWNPKDSSLVINDRMTPAGLTVYWNAIDATFKFNATRHEIFMAKHLWQENQKAEQAASHVNQASTSQCRNETTPESSDPMKSFFQHHSCPESTSGYHAERHMDAREDRRHIYVEDYRNPREDNFIRRSGYHRSGNNRFLLPWLRDRHF